MESPRKQKRRTTNCWLKRPRRRSCAINALKAAQAVAAAQDAQQPLRAQEVAAQVAHNAQEPSLASQSSQKWQGLLSLPREIHLAILGRLGPRDLHAVRRVSTYFETVARDPRIWKDYEVWNNDMTTSDVINDLKQMPLLKKIHINNRVDSDDILRQISLSNKKLEQLYISNCTGSTFNLYLRPAYLTRILERCRRLHTVSVFGTRFRGLKFYRLLGKAGPRLRYVSTTATRAQFETFARHASHIADKDRDLICILSRAAARNTWGPMQYHVTERKGLPNTILISYSINSTNLACLQLQTLPTTTRTTA